MSDYAVIISARMSSTRLPGKALVSYCSDGTPNLQQIIMRWKDSDRAPLIIVATSDGADDVPIVDLCIDLGVPFWSGSRDDVVSRMDGAIKRYAPDAKYIARALADNPLVDVELADWRLDVMRETGADGLFYGGDEARLTYAATTDVFSRAAWDRIAAESTGAEREHPGLYFWNHIEKFSAVQLTLPRAEYLLPIRTELDTPEDLAMLRELWGVMDGPCVNTLDALRWLSTQPGIVALNSGVAVKTQTAPIYARGTSWVCPDCKRSGGRIVAGNLSTRCSKCGRPRKFYAQKPLARNAH